MSFAELSGSDKEELIVSLAALLCNDAEVELSADNLTSAVTASGNKIAPYWAAAFGSMLAQVEDFSKFTPAPGGGGGAAPAAAGGDAAAPAEAAKEEEEESAEEMGGMDMFGGGGSDY